MKFYKVCLRLKSTQFQRIGVRERCGMYSGGGHMPARASAAVAAIAPSPALGR